MTTTAKAYALGYLRDVAMGDDIVAYLETIDATMAPYGGRFIVHGGHLTPLEGSWGGDLIIIEFPDREAALAWYASEAYQEILALRTANSDGMVAVVDGVPNGYRAVEKLGALLG